MIRVVFECDRCGAEIPGEIGYLDWGHTDRVNRERTDENAFSEMHFCENCMEEIGAFIAGNRIRMPGQEEPPKEAPAEAAREAKKEAEAVAAQAADAAEPDAADDKVDWPKVFALRKAGWKIKEIAEEFGGKVSEQQIRNKIAYENRKQIIAQAKEQEVSA